MSKIICDVCGTSYQDSATQCPICGCVRPIDARVVAGSTEEQEAIKKSLGEALREQRLRCQMTQEFVAERLGVSRQAVSKWENGTSDPSTSNLLALAKLYGVSAEELLRAVEI